MSEEHSHLDATAPLQTSEAWEQLDYLSPSERRDFFVWLSDIQTLDQTETRVKSARELVGI